MERRNEKLGKGNDVHSGQRLIPIVIPSEARDLGSCLRLHIPRSLAALGMTNPQPYDPWHFLYFFPDPHGQGSFLPTLS